MHATHLGRHPFPVRQRNPAASVLEALAVLTCSQGGPAREREPAATQPLATAILIYQYARPRCRCKRESWFSNCGHGVHVSSDVAAQGFRKADKLIRFGQGFTRVARRAQHMNARECMLLADIVEHM